MVFKLLLLVFLSQPLPANDEPLTGYEKAIIEDPALSERCAALLTQRRQKIQAKQKLNSLIVRNQKLDGYVPQSRQTLIKKINTTQKKLEIELVETNQKIKKLEETIIKKGCPGIVPTSI